MISAGAEVRKKEVRNYLNTVFHLTGGLAEEKGLSSHHDCQIYRSITFYGGHPKSKVYKTKP